MARAYFNGSGEVVCATCCMEAETNDCLQPIDAVDLEDMFPAGVWCCRCGLALVAPLIDEEMGENNFEQFVDDPNEGEVD